MEINEILRAFKEDAEMEVIAPGFAGFYNSIYCNDGDNEEGMYSLFNEPSDIPQEIYDFLEDKIDYNMEEYEKEVGEEYTKQLNEALKPELPNLNAEFVEIDSPREYNMRTDYCIIKIDLGANIADIQKYIEDNKEAFKEYIAREYKSRDGFIPYQSDNADEWTIDMSMDDGQVYACLDFICENEGYTNGEFDLNDKTDENVIKPWDYGTTLDEIKEKFKFNVQPTEWEDLQFYNDEPVDGVYIWNKENPDQQKLDLGVE